MPLRAIVNGESIIAPFLSPDEWERLKIDIKSHEKDLRLPCCSNTGHLRTSKLGTNHFVHSRKQGCDWKPESLEHLKAKSIIALACRDAGYDVITEYSGTDWRADVLAVKNSIKIAFEVQLSRQTLEETQQRQEKYRRDGVRGCWFFPCVPKNFKEVTKDLPIFSLTTNNGNTSSYSVRIPLFEDMFDHYPPFPLKDFVRSLLNRRIKFCESHRIKRHQRLKIVFYETKCWKCNKICHVFYLSSSPVSKCGHEIFKYGYSWESDKIEFNPAILQVIKDFINSPDGSHIKLGKIKSRYSKTVQHKYASFGCYYCDAIFGDWFVGNETMSARYREAEAPAVLETDIEFQDPLPTELGDHWCFSENGSFCE